MLILRNPFLIYIVSFLSVLLLYQLRWSYLLSPISTELFVFFVISFVISFYFAALLQRSSKGSITIIAPLRNGSVIMFILFISYFLEFIYYGGIPIISFFTHPGSKFVHFGGIPTFHVLLISFSTFYSVFLFHVALSTRKSRDIQFFLMAISVPFLIFNRGMFINISIGCFFVFIHSINRISFKQICIVLVVFLFILFGFGVSGNYRVSHSNSSKNVLQFYKATPEFKNSIVPSEYLWSYMYFVAPIGNVQNCIIACEPRYSTGNFFLNNIVPDFIANRIVELSDIKVNKPPLISPMFNVGSMYFRAYYDYGWLGIILIFLFQCFLIFVTILLLPKRSMFFVSGVAVLSTIVLLNSFTNIMVFSGISFQLFWIILFGWFERRHKITN